MDYLFYFTREEEPKQDLYHLFMQDRMTQNGLSFYLYRRLLESLFSEQ